MPLHPPTGSPRLSEPSTGSRLPLAGINDGTDRYIIGYVTIHAGVLVGFASPPAIANDPRLNAANSVVGFGAIQTDGMVSITKENSTWILRPYPRWRNMIVLLKSTKFAEPAAVQLCGDTPGTVTAVAQGGYWQISITGAKCYCWSGN